MILRRLADSIKRQDWFVVFLELTIVVVGILAGLRVDDWNGQRKDRVAERDYLERLLAETSVNLSQVRAKAESYFDRAESISRVVAHIEQSTVDEIAPEDLTRTFCYWYIPEGIRLQSSTFDEMTATGSLDLLRDTKIRQLLQLAWSEHRRAKEENPKLSAFQSDLAKPLKDFTVWQFDAPRQNIDRNPKNVPIRAGCRVARQSLTDEPGITSLLVQLNRSQIILGNLHSNEQQALEDLLAALERAVLSEENF